jgi:alkanesulfonate monooxygenase SsuD/methylene tetrahydromethanopterin reductase-like flavin-dependent oxidoreductase (luciferase family)
MAIWPAAPGYCHPEIAASSMAGTLQLCKVAEDLGFDWVSVSEHHYAPYMMTPNPIVMAAAISQVVKKAKIALLGPLVPLNNPIRLAEEIAMLDTLSNGRVVVLFLRGTPNEHNTYDTPKEATRGMTQEGIDLILKAWRETEPFSWQGEHYKFSTISVWPRVQQSPHPFVYGSGNSDESVVFAAQRRLGIAFSFAPPEMIDKWVKLYRESAKAHGWTPASEHILYRGIAHLALTDAQADNDLAAHFGALAADAAKLQSKTMGGPPSVPLVTKPFFLGSPQTVRERFATLEACGVGVVDMCFPIGNQQRQMQSMELFANEVIPNLKTLEHTRARATSVA